MGNFIFVLFMLIVLVLKAVVELSPLIIAVAIYKGVKEYIRRGEYQRVETSTKPSRVRAALNALLHP